MARNTVHCEMCGKAFFPSSLPIHIKTCLIKSALIEIPCFYCREEYPKGEMAAHHLKCKEAKKARQSQPTNNTVNSMNSKTMSSTLRAPDSNSYGNDRILASASSAPNLRSNKATKSVSPGEGDYVELYGLTAKPEMNGLRGVIIGPLDPSTGRFAVKIDENESSFNLKPSSLKLVNPPGYDSSFENTSSSQPRVTFAPDTTGGNGTKSSGGFNGGGVGSSGFNGGGGFNDGSGFDGGKMDCAICGRSFAIDRISIHQRICDKLDKKAKMNPRKVFPAKKGRYDPEVQAAKKHAGPPPPKPKSKWRQQHLQFQSIVKGAREYESGVPSTNLNSGTRSSNKTMQQTDRASGGGGGGYDTGYDELNDLVPCPHCGRTFAPQTAERHIPKCKFIINKPKAPPSLRESPQKQHAASTSPIKSSAYMSRTGSAQGDRGFPQMRPSSSSSSSALRPSSSSSSSTLRPTSSSNSSTRLPGSSGRGRGKIVTPSSTGPNLASLPSVHQSSPPQQQQQHAGYRQMYMPPKQSESGFNSPPTSSQSQSRSQHQSSPQVSLGIIRSDHLEDWVGHRAIVIGTGRADMNGQSGICDSVAGDRVIVILNDGRRLGVRAANLVEDTDIDVIPVDSSNFADTGGTMSDTDFTMSMSSTQDFGATLTSPPLSSTPLSSSSGSSTSRMKNSLNNAISMDNDFSQTLMGTIHDGLTETIREEEPLEPLYDKEKEEEHVSLHPVINNTSVATAAVSGIDTVID